MVNHSRAPGQVSQLGNEQGVGSRPVTSFVHQAGESVVEPVASDEGFDIVHEWGIQSFPASDPPANW
jgi:hypothetical protein